MLGTHGAEGLLVVVLSSFAFFLTIVEIANTPDLAAYPHAIKLTHRDPWQTS